MLLAEDNEINREVALELLHGAGLAVVRGDVTLYIRLLRQLAANHRDDVQALRSELEAGQNDVATRRAHSLKGAAGSLGATGIQVAATALEQAVRNDLSAQAAADLLDSLTGEQLALEAIPSQLPVVEDTTALELLEDNQDLLVATFGQPAKLLAQQITNFDYPQALVTLRSLMQ